MTDKYRDEINALQASLIKIMMLEAPGAFLVALAAYAKFGANGEPFIPALQDEALVTGMFVLGGAIMAWCTWRVLTILRRRAALQSGNHIE